MARRQRYQQQIVAPRREEVGGIENSEYQQPDAAELQHEGKYCRRDSFHYPDSSESGGMAVDWIARATKKKNSAGERKSMRRRAAGPVAPVFKTPVMRPKLADCLIVKFEPLPDTDPTLAPGVLNSG